MLLDVVVHICNLRAQEPKGFEFKPYVGYVERPYLNKQMKKIHLHYVKYDLRTSNI